VTEHSDEASRARENRSDEEAEAQDSETVGELPKEVKDDLAQQIIRAEAYSYEAPVPPPSMLRGYEDVVPGSAKQIMNDAHGQMVHRHGLENKQLDAAISNSKRGQWFGFIIAVLVIVGGVTLILADRSVEGLALILPGLAALAGTFVYSQIQQSRELREKRETPPSERSHSPNRQPEIEEREKP
jgi:uncharacterized membrane protein